MSLLRIPLILSFVCLLLPLTAADQLDSYDQTGLHRVELPLEQARLSDESGKDFVWLPGELVVTVGVDGRDPQAWMDVAGHWRDVDLAECSWSDGQLTLSGRYAGPECHYTINARISTSGDQATGNGTVAYHRPEKDRHDEQAFQARGRVLDLEALREREAIAAGVAWPGWRGGPHAGSATGSTANQLVERMDDARFVWTSNERMPMPGHTDVQALSGYGELTIADDKVFVNYYVGHGEVFPEGKDLAGMRAEHKGKRSRWQENMQSYIASHYGGELDNYLKLKWSILADDVVDCYDAASGRLLWQATFPGKGLNWHNCDGPHFNPAYDDGRLFVVGSAGMLYALDADTGATLWQRSMPGYDSEAWQQRAIDEAATGNPTKHCGVELVGKPLAADGVVVVADRHCYGVDAASGEILWGPVKEISTGNPRLWRHAGTAYVLCRLDYSRGGDGRGIACLELQTGRVCWVDPSFIGDIGTEFAHDDRYLFSPGLPNADPDTDKVNKQLRDGYRPGAVLEPTCFLLSPQGLKKHWSLPLRGQVSNGTKMCAPVIYEGHVYALLETRPEPGADFARMLVCVDCETGEVVGKVPCGGSKSWTSLIAGDGRLMHHTFTSGQVELFSAAPDFRTLEFRQWSPPGTFQLLTWRLVDGRLFMREKEYSRIYCYDLRVAGK